MQAALGVAVGAAVGAAVGGILFDRPGLGAAAGGALALSASVTRGKSAPKPGASSVTPADETGDVVGFFPGGYGELYGGPGPWTPERMFLASQYKPDPFGWAMVPSTQSAYGPILGKGGPYGPAYLMMPATSTLPGSSTPGQGFFQQDVQMRAAEAARTLGEKLRSKGFRIQGRARYILNAVGIRFRADGGQLEIGRKTAGEIARVANLSAVLLKRGDKSYAIYFTDYPALVRKAADHRGEEYDQIAGLASSEAQSGAVEPGKKSRNAGGTASGHWDIFSPEAGNTFEHYRLAAMSGAAAGAGLGAIRKEVGLPLGAAVGAAVGLAVGALARESLVEPRPGETETEAIGREAVDRAMAGQAGRWLNVALWGPLMIFTGVRTKSRLGAILLTTTGGAVVGTTLREISSARNLRRRFDTAATRRRLAELAVSAPGGSS